MNHHPTRRLARRIRRTLTAAAVITVAFGATGAAAHTPNVQAGCLDAKAVGGVLLSDYTKGGTVTIQGGTPIAFAHDYTAGPIDLGNPTVDHTFTVIVASNDGVGEGTFVRHTGICTTTPPTTGGNPSTSSSIPPASTPTSTSSVASTTTPTTAPPSASPSSSLPATQPTSTPPSTGGPSSSSPATSTTTGGGDNSTSPSTNSSGTPTTPRPTTPPSTPATSTAPSTASTTPDASQPNGSTVGTDNTAATSTSDVGVCCPPAPPAPPAPAPVAAVSPPAPTLTVPTGTLPTTGSDNGSTFTIATATLLAGIALILAVRRRRVAG